MQNFRIFKQNETTLLFNGNFQSMETKFCYLALTMKAISRTQNLNYLFFQASPSFHSIV